MAERPSGTAPNVDLEWEERTFKAARGLWRRLWPGRKRERSLSPHARKLEVDAASFAALASMIAGRPLKVELTDGVGGLRGDVLLLPSAIDVATDEDENREIYSVRVCISAKMYAQDAAPSPDADPVIRSLRMLGHVERAVVSLRDELPGFDVRYRAACHAVLAVRPPLDTLRGCHAELERIRQTALSDDVWPRDLSTHLKTLERMTRKGQPSPPVLLWGELFASPAATASDGAGAPESGEHAAVQTELELDVAGDVRRKLLDPEEEFNPIIHTFEKVHTLDNHRGSMRYTDGSDDLDDELDALEEVDFSEVLRGGAPAESILRADVGFGGDIPDVARVDPGERGISYDEWDARRARYRRDWCTVYPTPVVAREPAWATAVARARRREIDALERRLRYHRSRLTSENRQRDGEEIDLDAVVRVMAATRAGESADDRLYVRQRRARRDFATTVLVDTSLSTDSWTANKRVLDIARESVLVLGEVSARLGDRLRVLAFASHTRNICRVWELHGWNDGWVAARDRLGLLRPQGYTRIGPALRHATADLADVAADRRLLLLISDGKPTDYDRYEGRYGMADIRQALREASRADIHAHALAIDSRAKSYLSATFGVGGWNVLADPEQLPRVMTEVYGRLTGR